MKLKLSTNAFDVEVKEIYERMGISRQYFYSIFDNKENISSKRASEMLAILKELDAKAKVNEEKILKERKEERAKMIRLLEDNLSKNGV